jgi:hypothetical protein
MPPSNKIISGIVLRKRKEDESNPWSIMGYLTVKTTLTVVNILIFVLGVATLSIASHILSIFTFGLPLDISRAVIVLGAFVTIVGAIGIYGVLSEKGMYLRTYMGLIALAIILKAITVILIITNSSQIDAYFDEIFQSSAPADVEKTETIQNAFECCGTIGCKFSDPCGPKLKSVYYRLTIPIGIAIGIEGLIVLICLLYISHLVKKSKISKSEMRAAWEQNKESIQKDYSKFDYA